MTKYIPAILLLILFCAIGFVMGLQYPRTHVVRDYLELEFKPGDRVLATHYKAGGVKIENALGTVIGLDYNPTWNPKEPIYYFVVFDDDVQKPEEGRSASGIKPSELKLYRK